MKKYLTILILLLSGYNTSLAQKLILPLKMIDNSCGTTETTEQEMQTKFYYGNNDRLQEKYDSLVAIYGTPSGNTNYRNGTFGGENDIWFRIIYTQNK